FRIAGPMLSALYALSGQEIVVLMAVCQVRFVCCPRSSLAARSSQVVSIIPWAIILIVTTGFALPSAAMSLDTIYSKMIGNIDQNVMQSVFVIADDIIQIFGPIYAS
ncbi:hypothetical protein PENTCL1PPCAC_14048, partial [Pristionchus entomophagus]